MTAARRWYGAGPLHLLAMLAALGVAGVVASKVLGLASLPGLVLWFVGAAVLHDALLVPAYSVLDRGLVAALGRRRSGAPERSLPVPALNHVRIPLALSLLLLALFFPLVLGTQESGYEAATDLSVDVYASRYLAVVATLAGASLLLYLVRVVRAR